MVLIPIVTFYTIRDMPKCRENIRREALLANVKQRKKHYLALRESYFLTKKRWDHLQSQIQVCANDPVMYRC